MCMVYQGMQITGDAKNCNAIILNSNLAGQAASVEEIDRLMLPDLHSLSNLYLVGFFTIYK